MKAGALRRRVTIQKKSTSVDSSGFPANDAWSDVATLWANVQPLPTRAREYYAAAGINADKTVMVTIRYRSDVMENMRVVYGSRTFDIWTVLDTDSRHIESQLICREVTDGG